MLSPNDRRLLLDVLAPPEGYALDQAIGTTYTLDLLALLRVPLAATALPWADRSGGPVENPFALLTALRRNASRISLYCHAGATVVPARHVPLLTFLEDAVHPVTPPRRGGVFHPKLWLLRFAPDDSADRVAYRLVVLSRNLTFDRSWDTALVLDGDLLPRQRLAVNEPLSELVATLPQLARAAGTELSSDAERRAAQLADEVNRVQWWVPDGFDTLQFHALGHDGESQWPFQNLRRLLVISPYVGPETLERLRSQVSHDLQVVGRFEEFIKLPPGLLERFQAVHVFDDPSPLLDVDVDHSVDPGERATDDPELSGLHAKVYIGERRQHAVVYVGSANATGGAFDRNVEFLAELEGSRREHGIDAATAGLLDARLLTAFRPAETAAPDDVEGSAAQRELERAAHELAMALHARYEAVDENHWRPVLELTRPVSTGAVQIEARPLAEATFRTVDLTASPCCVFRPLGRTSVSAFFALRVTSGVREARRFLDVTLRLPIDGAPDDRAEAVTAELLSDRARLLRFILLLLSDDASTDRMLDELAGLGERGSGSSEPRGGGAFGLPLLEPLLRALHRDPRRLDEIGRLLTDIRVAGGDTSDLLPPDLEDLWQAVSELRESRA